MIRRGFTLRETLVATALCFLLFGCLLGPAIPYALFMAAFGWIRFLLRVVPQVTISWAGAATAAVCSVAFLLGTHWFLRWLYAEWRQNGASSEPSTELRPADSWKLRWTVGLTSVAVLMFVAGICVTGLAHQTAWLATSKEPLMERSGRMIMSRVQAANNLRQIGRGALDYHEANRTFPRALFTPTGQPLHSWQTAILPFGEHRQLFDQIKQSVAWDDPRNQEPFMQRVDMFLVPLQRQTKDARGYALSHFASNAYVLGGDRQFRAADIKDGPNHTILAGEAAGNFRPWGDPVNWRDPALGVNQSPDGFGGPHLGVVQFVFADGHAAAISADIDPTLFRALCTPGGGEDLSQSSEFSAR